MLSSVYLKLIGAGLILALFVGVYGYGHHAGAAGVQAKWDADVKVRAAALQIVQAKSAQITTKVVTQYVDRVQVVHDQAATIVKRVPVYVTQKADAACTVPIGFVRLHDAAVRGTESPDAAGRANDDASGVELSRAGATIAGNYGICRATATQLNALQDWVRQQAALQ